MHGGIEQTDVTDRANTQILDQGEDVLQREVLGHRPRRSRRSA